MTELSNLSALIDEIDEQYPNSPLYLRGDFNVSFKNKKRRSMLDFFLSSHSLKEVVIDHTTYHHFTGNGNSDSHLDKLIYRDSNPEDEALITIICKLDCPLVSSSHDILLSSWIATKVDFHPETIVDEAPKMQNTRFKTLWTDEGIKDYQNLITPHLERLQKLWLSDPSPTCLSLFSAATNQLMTSCAKFTNRTRNLHSYRHRKSRPFPKQIRNSSKKLLKMYHELKELKASSSHKDSPGVRELQSLYGSHRTQHRKLIRSFKAADSIARDASLMTNPSATFSRIRSSNKASAGKLSKLIVGDKAFIGDRVPDGFYAAMKDLKMRDYDKLKTSPHFHDFSCDYMNILKLSKSSKGIKPITESESLQILQSMKSDVLDFFSVSPNHYLHAGPAGCRHFHSLMKALLSDVGTTAIHEVNAAYACILFKGHGKDRTSSRSYRTISTCPVVAKGLDLYIRKIHGHSWKNAQPSTQFQGEGSSHELAAVLLTECIQFSRFTLKKPLYVLYLDAKSAFDGVLRELLIKNLYEVQELDKSLLLINNRLENRSTFLDWDGNLVGPIHDQQGLEQGGCNSSEFYKIFAKEQLNLVQKTNFGVYFGQNLVISGIGQADDLALLSNDLHKLYYLLNLTIISCQKYNIELCAEKTRLQAFLPTNGALDYDIFNPIKIHDVQIEFATTAEHVGILRAIDGNRSAILARLTAHKRA